MCKVKAMTDLAERIALAKDIDEAKLTLAMNVKGQPIFVTDQQLKSMDHSTSDFVRKYNDFVLSGESKRSTNAR